MIESLDNTARPWGAGAPEDSELLRRYADSGSDAAFAELVRRRIGLVYAVALRRTCGDAHRAEDATQAVFIDLARKAGVLARRPVLVGWLHRSAHFAATGLMRAEHRRRVREQEADTMQNDSASAEPHHDWERVRPVLDEALNEIDERDRDAILLRFFDVRSFAEIGAHLRLTDSAARMRVERALDKLHAALARRGIRSTMEALGVALGSHATAAPAGLAANVAGAALAKTAAAAGGSFAAFMSMTKIQAGIIGAFAVAGVTGFMQQAESNADLRRELVRLRENQRAISGLRAENQRLAGAVAEVEMLRRSDAELAQLAREVDEVRKARAAESRVVRAQADERRFQEEVDRMNKEGNALVLEYMALAERSKDASLSGEERAQAIVAVQQKLEAIQAKKREIGEFIAGARNAIPQSASRPVDGLVLENKRQGEERAPTAAAAADNVALTLNGDLRAALSTYEKCAGGRIVRDPSLAEVRGTVTLNTGLRSKVEVLQALRAALRDQLNVVLEPAADGNLVARARSP